MTTKAVRQWRADNKKAISLLTDTVCGRCGLKAINVQHNVDPADQIEGPDYYADVDLHPFEAPSEIIAAIEWARGQMKTERPK